VKKVILAVLAFQVSALAQDSYKIMGKNVRMYDQKSLQITASVECKLSKDKKECTNMPYLKKVSMKAVGRLPAGNPNPGAVICEDQLDGNSVIGQDEDQNQMSFCHLSKQNVYVDNATITYHALKNDGVVLEDIPLDF
jgi:hypothetical protein